MRSYLHRMLFPLLAAKPGLVLNPGWAIGAGQSGGRGIPALRRALWQQLDRSCVVRWLEGLRLYLHPGNEMCQAIYLTGQYEPNEFTWLASILQPGMTVIDAGANMGLYTIYAAKRVGAAGRVIAIEPSKRELARLRANVKINGLKIVHIHEVAISDCSGDSELLVAIDQKSGHNTLGSFGYDSVIAERRERVPVRRLDELVQEEGLKWVHLIKMDIEGAELCALQGCQQVLMDFHPTMLIEVSDRTLGNQGHSGREVLHFLNERGYKVLMFDAATGLPVPCIGRVHFEAENIIAVHATYPGYGS